MLCYYTEQKSFPPFLYPAHISVDEKKSFHIPWHMLSLRIGISTWFFTLTKLPLTEIRPNPEVLGFIPREGTELCSLAPVTVLTNNQKKVAPSRHDTKIVD